MFTRLIALSLCCLFTCSPEALTQSIEWLARVPRVPRSLYPSAQTVYHDTVRNKLATLGWQMGTVLYSADSGHTWSGDYNIFTDVVKKEPFLFVFPNGHYHYGGRTPWNAVVSLISEDGGATFRRLTMDPRIRRTDGHSYAHTIIPPYGLVAWDTSGTQEYLTMDYGATWRPYPTLPTTSSVKVYPRPYVVYQVMDGWYHAFDTRTDTAWSRTTIPSAFSNLSELGAMTVGSRYGRFAIRTHPDSAFSFIDTWPDPGTDTNALIDIEATLIADDSTIYAFDGHGFTFAVSSPTGSVRLVSRTRFLTPYAQSTNFLRAMQSSTEILVYYNDLLAKQYDGKRSRIIVHHDLTTGNVSELRTKPRDSFLQLPGGTETFHGGIGLFMMSEDSELREVVRSDDHGATWRHPEHVFIPQLDPTFLETRHTLRLPDQSLVLQTVYDHVIVRDTIGWLERRQYATDAHDWTRYFGGYGHEHVRHCRPTITTDNGSLYTFDPTLVRLDPSTMMELDTVLPRRASFLRRFSPTFLAAGRDSLWLSFNDGKEWFYVEGGMGSEPDSTRGSVSDVVQGLDGTLLCAYRGMDWTDTAETRGLLYRGGITRSTDDGNTWRWAAQWPADHPHVGKMAVLPSGTILANAAHIELDRALKRDYAYRLNTRVTRAGLMRSVDGGQSWQRAFTDFFRGGPFPDVERTIISMPGGQVLATTLTGLIIRSNDDGATWSILDLPQLGDATVYGMWLDTDGTVLISTSIGAARLIIPGVTTVAEATTAPSRLAITSSGYLQITTHDDLTTLHLVDIDGSIALTSNVVEGTTLLDTSHLVPGCYGYRLLNKANTTFGVIMILPR